MPTNPLHHSVFPIPRNKWTPDSDHKTCMSCQTKFKSGLFTSGKHHCRKCGFVICKECCKYRIRNHRVCNDCYAKYSVYEYVYTLTIINSIQSASSQSSILVDEDNQSLSISNNEEMIDVNSYETPNIVSSRMNVSNQFEIETAQRVSTNVSITTQQTRIAVVKSISTAITRENKQKHVIIGDNINNINTSESKLIHNSKRSTTDSKMNGLTKPTNQQNKSPSEDLKATDSQPSKCVDVNDGTVPDLHQSEKNSNDASKDYDYDNFPLSVDHFMINERSNEHLRKQREKRSADRRKRVQKFLKGMANKSESVYQRRKNKSSNIKTHRSKHLKAVDHKRHSTQDLSSEKRDYRWLQYHCQHIFMDNENMDKKSNTMKNRRKRRRRKNKLKSNKKASESKY